MASPTQKHDWRYRLHEIIFEADTPGGKAFDVMLIVSILMSIAVVMLESVETVRQQVGHELRLLEWGFTILFSIEYLLRIVTIRKPHRYIISFYGLVDLIAILPTYLSLLFPGGQYLLVIRILRILRVFRVLRLVLYLREGEVILQALRGSRRKITVFLFAVVTLVTIIGSLMYMIEGSENGFTSIPAGIYWAVVTLTTVGYGDIAPVTILGKFLATVVMIMGYSIIAVPTGIVTAEVAQVYKFIDKQSTQACRECSLEGHAKDATYCKYCGAKL
ncbi:ion transporter [bacterium]|nr:ion transporter [bacterium]